MRPGIASPLSLQPRCFTVRPERGSGWFAFFEVVLEGDRAGHFLVVGPGRDHRAEDVDAALRAGQGAVRYLKETPTSAPPATILEGVLSIFEHEGIRTGALLEYGCGIVYADMLHVVTSGSVRLLPIAARTAAPQAAAEPAALPLTSQSRYFLGRIPAGLDDGASVAAWVSTLEAEGGAAGGLLLSFAERTEGVPPAGLRAVRRPSGGSLLRPTVPAPTVPSAAEPPAPAVAPPERPADLPLFAGPPGPPPPVREPVPPEAGLATEGESFPGDPEAAQRGSVDAVPPPRESDRAETRGDSPGAHADDDGADSTIQPLAQRAAEAASLYAPEERRGLVFWLGALLLVAALSLAAVYVFWLRPRVAGEGGPVAREEAAPPAEATNADAGTGGVAGSEPELVWTATFGDAVSSSPLLDGDRVVFGCRDGRVYALDAATGRQSWAYAADKGFGSSPARVGGTIVIGGYDGIIYGLDADTGIERWRVATAGRIVASPAADSSGAYIGSYDRHLYAVDGESGQLRWKANLESVLWSSPVCDGSRVIAAGLDGRVHALDAATGRIQWTAVAGGQIYGTPALGERKVFVGTKEAALFAFVAETGDVLWKIDVPAAVHGSPAYHEGRLVVGLEDGTVLGIDVGLGVPVWTVKLGDAVRARPVFADRLVWVPSYDGSVHGIEWLTGLDARSVPVETPVYSSPAARGGILFFGGMDGRFFALRVSG